MSRCLLVLALIVACLPVVPVAAQNPPNCDPAFLINSLSDFKSSKDTIQDLQILGRLDDEIQDQLKNCQSLLTTQTPQPEPSSTTTPSLIGPVAAPFGSRNNAVPLGHTIEITYAPSTGYGTLEITVVEVYSPADSEIYKANQFNDSPAIGQHYLIAEVHVSYVGGDPNKDVSVSYGDFTSLSDNQILPTPTLVWPSNAPKLDLHLLPNSTGRGFVIGKYFLNDKDPMLVLGRTDTFPGWYFNVTNQ